MDFTNPVIIGISAAGYIVGTAALLYGAGVGALQLAKKNIFFTTVEEGQAKAVTINGRFRKFLMSYSGHVFKHQNDGGVAAATATPADDWEIKPLDHELGFFERKAYLPKFLRGIRWIGLPPFAETYTYHFRWESVVQTTSGTEVNLNDEHAIGHILVRSDIYGAKLLSAECRDNIPLNVPFFIYGRVINPYKALFQTEKWLEATINLITGHLRTFVGTHSYDALRQAKNNDADSSRDIAEHLKAVYAIIEKDFGFKIERLEIQDVEPASELAKDFIKASTQAYVAEEKAKAIIAEAKGESARVKGIYDEVAKIPGGVDMYKWDKIAQSGLATYVEGSAPQKPVLALPTTPGGST